MKATINVLQDRAAMLAKARAFFADRNVLEVDCPLLSPRASVDAHIDLIPVQPLGEIRYLHSSPEYGMKRLIAKGIGDIYQLSHVFRDGECGIKHNPEFTMAEWYRLGFTFSQMIQETIEFIQLFVGACPITTISYRDAFKKYVGIDYVQSSSEQLLNLIHTKKIPTYPNIECDGKDALLNLILGTLIEPYLGQESLCALAYYPSTQAALAQTRWHGDEKVSERFEVYYKGIELANGYHELADPIEQRQRLIEANEERKKLKKNPLPIDEYFLQALEEGLPDCCGVAVGFDRLMMLRHHATHIAQVLPFSWPFA